MSNPQQGARKPKVFKFASLNKLIKFDNTDPACDGMNLSVTASGPSKVQFQVYNTNTNSGLSFSFYLIDIIPWVEDIIAVMSNDIEKPVLHKEIAGSLPEFARKPGKPASGSFIVSSDDDGPYIQMTVDNATLPKWRFKPIPSTLFIEGGKPISYSDNHRMLAWLKIFVGTVTLVSDYIAAIEAREWTPPGESIEIKPTANVESKPAPSSASQDVGDDDIPFSRGEPTTPF